ncbi:MAG TPA: sulfatase [Bacteroidales bacterium]|nr:sulfatase [Bacteroidales bacterium]
MRRFIKILPIGIAASLTSAGQTTDIKPNILWIIADDLGTDLACYGNKAVSTPNTDRLAEEGITYTNFFTVVPVSSPSRSCLITGMYPVSIDCHQHRTLRKNLLPEGVLPITEYFRKAGYWVCNGNGTNMGKQGKTDFNFDFGKKQLFDGPDWKGKKPGQPFFAQMQIHYPHRPFEKDTLHAVDRNKVQIHPAYPDHPLTREDFAEYLESVQLVDYHVGRILARLEEEGILGNTIIMFFGDQGRPMVRAKQFLYDEGIHAPLIVRFPDKRKENTVNDNLISIVDIPATTLALAGIELPQNLQGQNFYSGKQREHVFITRDRMDETVDRMRAVRTKKFKYIRNYYPELPYNQFNTYKVTMYPVLTLMKVMQVKGQLTPEQSVFMSSQKKPEELYDLIKDPFELHNIAEERKYSKQLRELRTLLNDWVSINDKGVYPENSEETGYWKQDAGQAYVKAMKSYGLDPGISDETFLDWWIRRLIK